MDGRVDDLKRIVDMTDHAEPPRQLDGEDGSPQHQALEIIAAGAESLRTFDEIPGFHLQDGIEAARQDAPGMEIVALRVSDEIADIAFHRLRSAGQERKGAGGLAEHGAQPVRALGCSSALEAPAISAFFPAAISG